MMDMFARFRFAGLSRLTVLSFLLFGFTTSFASELIDSTRSGDLETVASLITDGSDLNEATGDGMTAVHWPDNKNRQLYASAFGEQPGQQRNCQDAFGRRSRRKCNDHQ